MRKEHKLQSGNELDAQSIDELHAELVVLAQQRPVWDDIGQHQRRTERQRLLTNAYVEKLLELADDQPRLLNLDKAALLLWNPEELNVLYRALLSSKPVSADE